jgi:hypothetical protein
MTSASTIAQTLASKGQTVTIAGTASATYDPATSTTTPTAYSATGAAVILPMNPYKAQANSEIVAGDEQMLLAAVQTNGAALTKPPLLSTVTLADGTTKFTLIAVDPLHPSGDELLWDCIVRGHA